MSLNSSQQSVAGKLAARQGTTGIPLTLMACVQVPVFASKVTAAFVLKPCSVGLPWSRTNGTKIPVPDEPSVASESPMYWTVANASVVQAKEVVLFGTWTSHRALVSEYACATAVNSPPARMTVANSASHRRRL